MTKGCFADMVNEYFVNTFLITDNGYGEAMWKAFIVKNSTDWPITLKTISECVLFVGCVLFCRRRRFSSWILFAFIPFFLFVELKAPVGYYVAATIPFFVYPLCEFTQLTSILLHRMSKCKYYAFLTIVFITGIAFNVHANRLAFMAGEPSERFVATEQVLMRKPFCKIMYSGYDIGWGIRARALPACKYWALQNGASETMKSERAKNVCVHKADYIIAIPNYAHTNKWLLSCGYRQCSATVVENGKTIEMALPVYAKE